MLTNSGSLENKHPKVIFCVYLLAILAVVYTAYIAQDLILLIMIAGLVSLLLSGGVKLLEKFWIPRPIGATVLIACLVVPTFLLLAQLQEPVTKWAKLLPELSNHVTEQINEINQVIETKQAQPVVEKESGWFSWFEEKAQETPPASDDNDMIQTRLKESLLGVVSDFMVSAPFALIQIATTVILILFTLIYSPKLFHHYVELFVAKDQQERAFTFANNAQRELSKYILTVSVINIALAVCAIILFTFLGLEDALLLGILVGLFNFIPYVGPLFAIALISVAGLVQWGTDINVLFTVGGVLLLNMIESQFVTPLVLAKNMRINPFIIILWLLLVGWLWGLLGILIAVPLLVCIKLLLTQFKASSKWVTFLAT